MCWYSNRRGGAVRILNGIYHVLLARERAIGSAMDEGRLSLTIAVKFRHEEDGFGGN